MEKEPFNTKEQIIPDENVKKEDPKNYQGRFQSVLSKIPQVDFELFDEKALFENKSQILEKYKKENIEQEIEFIFSIIDHLKNQFEINKLKRNGLSNNDRRIQDLKISITESFYLDTNYILNNKTDREYLKSLFGVAQSIAEKCNSQKEWTGIKRGLIGQVGLYNFLEKYNLSPELASPKEDALQHIDMWGKTQEGASLAIQGKYMASAKEPHFIDSEEKLNKWFSQQKEILHEDQIKNLGKLLKDYKDMNDFCKNKGNTKPAIVILPRGSVDPDTGELVVKYFDNFKLQREKNGKLEKVHLTAEYFKAEAEEIEREYPDEEYLIFDAYERMKKFKELYPDGVEMTPTNFKNLTENGFDSFEIWLNICNVDEKEKFFKFVIFKQIPDLKTAIQKILPELEQQLGEFYWKKKVFGDQLPEPLEKLYEDRFLAGESKESEYNIAIKKSIQTYINPLMEFTQKIDRTSDFLNLSIELEKITEMEIPNYRDFFKILTNNDSSKKNKIEDEIIRRKNPKSLGWDAAGEKIKQLKEKLQEKSFKDMLEEIFKKVYSLKELIDNSMEKEANFIDLITSACYRAREILNCSKSEKEQKELEEKISGEQIDWIIKEL